MASGRLASRSAVSTRRTRSRRTRSRLGCAFAVALGAFMALVLAPQGPALAAMLLLEAPAHAKGDVLTVAQEGLRLHHRKRVTEAYCLKRNYWWFYRPYTTAGEDYPRCEPYFHYREPAGGSGNAWVDRAMK